MSAKNSSIKKDQITDLENTLSKCKICVVGGLATGQKVIRNLYRAGARKIILLNVDRPAAAEELILAGSDYDSNEFCQKLDIGWTIANIENYVREADIIVDALSDWQKKVALSDICMEFGKVLIHSGISGFRFQIYTMIPGRSACLRCALPLAGIDEMPLRPAVEPTIDAVIELVDAWQSLEAIKYLAQVGIIQGNELFKFDCLSGEFEVIRGLDANLDCPDCGRKLNRRMPPAQA